MEAVVVISARFGINHLVFSIGMRLWSLRLKLLKLCFQYVFNVNYLISVIVISVFATLQKGQAVLVFWTPYIPMHNILFRNFIPKLFLLVNFVLCKFVFIFFLCICLTQFNVVHAFLIASVLVIVLFEFLIFFLIGFCLWRLHFRVSS